MFFKDGSLLLKPPRTGTVTRRPKIMSTHDIATHDVRKKRAVGTFEKTSTVCFDCWHPADGRAVEWHKSNDDVVFRWQRIDVL